MTSWEVSDWIAGLGVLLGLLSLVIAVLALVYSRRSVLAAERSARAAEASAELESGRLHTERTPRWKLDLEPIGRGVEQVHRLTLELLTHEAMDHVTLVSFDPSLISFRDNQDGVPTAGDRAESVRQVRPGRRDDAAWMVLIPKPSPGGTCRIQITASIDAQGGRPGGEWASTVDLKLPTRPASMSSGVVRRR